MWRSATRDMDERALAVEHRAGWVAFQAMGYLLILDMVLHTWRPGITDQTLGLLDRGFPLDIIAVMAGGSIAHAVVVLKERTVTPRRAKVAVAMLAVGAVVAAMIAILLSRVL